MTDLERAAWERANPKVSRLHDSLCGLGVASVCTAPCSAPWMAPVCTAALVYLNAWLLLAWST